MAKTAPETQGKSRKTRFLFVCASNLDRSPAAESLFADGKEIEAKSCGVNPHSKQVPTRELIEWADYVFAMNEWHKDRILKLLPDTRVFVLNVADTYLRNDPKLLDTLIERLEKWSEKNGPTRLKWSRE